MLPLRIALRYLFAPKSHKAVNVITVISMAGIAVATLAIVVVLSVFNGFTNLAFRQLSAVDPELKISRSDARPFDADSVVAALAVLDGIETAMPTIEEKALLIAEAGQTPVKIKGVDHAVYPQISAIDSLIIDGSFESVNGLPDSITGAQIGVGVAVAMQLRPSAYQQAVVYVPRRLGRINPANPAAAYLELPLAITGVVRVDHADYDNQLLLLPIDKARELLQYDEEMADAVELKLAPNADGANVQKRIQQLLGADYNIANRMQQQSDTFKMIAVEKWITFTMLVFILLIASFNIISTLSLLVIEKRDNMETLRALGAPQSMISHIFVLEGWLITAGGGLIGIILGSLLVLLQQHFGFIRLAGDPATLTVPVYPVQLQLGDIAMVLVAVLLTGLAIAQISRLFTRK